MADTSRIGTAIMGAKDGTEAVLLLRAYEQTVMIACGVRTIRLTVDEAKALRRQLSKCIREASHG